MISGTCGWVVSLMRYLAVSGLVAGFAVWRIAPTWAENGPPLRAQPCLVIDTDVGLDDFRAFAVVLPQRAPRAVVVTEGIASVPGGSTAIALFLASAPSSAPVIPGLAAATPPAYDWLPDVRAGAERINGFLAQAVPFARQAKDMTRALEQATQGCDGIDVLVLGPWSSFVRYAPVLKHKIRRVLASGRPLAENNPDNFNCVYDQPACEAADSLLRERHAVAWVDLPADSSASPSYAPTEAMVEHIAQTGMPGVLRAALRLDPTQWLGTRLWDDTAALYLLAPQDFTVNGAHLEPAIDEKTLRQRLVKAINATPAQ
jgi:inosine-uridine nucleoside N-ribohydrolase